MFKNKIKFRSHISCFFTIPFDIKLIRFISDFVVENRAIFRRYIDMTVLVNETNGIYAFVFKQSTGIDKVITLKPGMSILHEIYPTDYVEYPNVAFKLCSTKFREDTQLKNEIKFVDSFAKSMSLYRSELEPTWRSFYSKFGSILGTGTSDILLVISPDLYTIYFGTIFFRKKDVKMMKEICDAVCRTHKILEASPTNTVLREYREKNLTIYISKKNMADELCEILLIQQKLGGNKEFTKFNGCYPDAQLLYYDDLYFVHDPNLSLAENLEAKRGKETIGELRPLPDPLHDFLNL